MKTKLYIVLDLETGLEIVTSNYQDACNLNTYSAAFIGEPLKYILL